VKGADAREVGTLIDRRVRAERRQQRFVRDVVEIVSTSEAVELGEAVIERAQPVSLLGGFDREHGMHPWSHLAAARTLCPGDAGGARDVPGLD
jgi:hypothetical protein